MSAQVESHLHHVIRKESGLLTVIGLLAECALLVGQQVVVKVIVAPIPDPERGKTRSNACEIRIDCVLRARQRYVQSLIRRNSKSGDGVVADVIAGGDTAALGSAARMAEQPHDAITKATYIMRASDFAVTCQCVQKIPPLPCQSFTTCI